MESKKVALFGGSFNPIHNHHISMVNEILNKKTADEVWIIPSKNHPFNKQLAPAEDRINMINLAFNNPYIKINTIEINSPETNYTIRTVQKLKAQYPYEFYWTIGADILADMKDKWYGLEDLLKETEFIIFNREGCPINYIPNMKIKTVFNIPTHGESSSRIRRLASQNKPLKELVPLNVEEYIKEKRLYVQ